MAQCPKDKKGSSGVKSNQLFSTPEDPLTHRFLTGKKLQVIFYPEDLQIPKNPENVGVTLIRSVSRTGDFTFILEHVNTYGSLAGFIVGLGLRLLGGEQILKLTAVLQYPYYDAKTNTQNFPYKTFTMLIALLTEIAVSILMNWLFKSGKIAARHDRFNACVNEREENDYLSNVGKNIQQVEGGSKLTINEQPSNIDDATLQEISKANNPEPVSEEQIDMVEYNDKYKTNAAAVETTQLVPPIDEETMQPSSESEKNK